MVRKIGCQERGTHIHIHPHHTETHSHAHSLQMCIDTTHTKHNAQAESKDGAKALLSVLVGLQKEFMPGVAAEVTDGTYVFALNCCITTHTYT